MSLLFRNAPVGPLSPRPPRVVVLLLGMVIGFLIVRALVPG